MEKFKLNDKTLDWYKKVLSEFLDQFINSNCCICDSECLACKAHDLKKMLEA